VFSQNRFRSARLLENEGQHPLYRWDEVSSEIVFETKIILKIDIIDMQNATANTEGYMLCKAKVHPGERLKCEHSVIIIEAAMTTTGGSKVIE
jgi:hypothetical protein